MRKLIIYFFLMFTLLPTLNAVSNGTIINSTVVAYWTMCEDSGNITDYKGISNSTIASGNITYHATTDQFGGNCSIDLMADSGFIKIGDTVGAIQVDNIINNIENNNFSIVMRFQDISPDVNDVYYFFADSASGVSNERIKISKNAPTGYISSYFKTERDTDNNIIYLSSTTNPSNNIWHTLVITYDFENDIYNMTIDLIEISSSTDSKIYPVFDLSSQLSLGGAPTTNIPNSQSIRLGEIAVLNISINKSILNQIQGSYIGNLIIEPQVLPIAENVSIKNSTGQLPLDANIQAKGYANYYDSNGDKTGGNQTIWFINGTREVTADNQFFLNTPNVTGGANLIFSIRFNDTYDWGNWVNSSQITVTDSAPPSLINCSLSFSSITSASGNTNNFTCLIQDVLSNIESASFNLWTPNSNLSRTMTLNGTGSYVQTTYPIFQSSESLVEGSYSITNISFSDTSGNSDVNQTTYLNFTVTSVPSSGGTTTGGGGGGGSTPSCPSGQTLNTSGFCVNATIIQVNATQFQTFPNSDLDTYFLFGAFQSNILEWRNAQIRTNIVIANCTITNGFICQIINENNILLTRNVENTNFLTTLIPATLRLKSLDGQIIQKVVRLRVLNIAYSL